MPEHTPAPTPARSLYGFFMFLFFKAILGIYCTWAFVPDEILHYLNIYYYPLKYWATAIPIQFLVALTLFAFIIYPSSNLMLTVDIDSHNTYRDIHSQNSYSYDKNMDGDQNLKCICKDLNNCSKKHYVLPPNDLDDNTVHPLNDLDIRQVCKKMYSVDRRKNNK